MSTIRPRPLDREADNLTHRVLDWLDRQQDNCPAGIKQGAWDYGVRYTRGRYKVGLTHYRRLFQELGWSDRRHGLDVGSGAGHWALAFALDNDRATGVDLHEEFVHLANGAATIAGLAERVGHRRGNAEALDFPDCSFDAVWAHSVLMFCDIEDAISEIARVLEPGGEFYCGYSSTGFRLSNIYSAILSQNQLTLQDQLGNYVGASLQRYGMSYTPWSQIRCATIEELTAVFRLFGLSVVRRPGLSDGSRYFAGIPSTIDLLCVRDSDTRKIKSKLLELALTDVSNREHLRELVRLGLGKLVHDVLRERGEAHSSSELRSLHALARMRAGPAEAAAALAQDDLDPLVRGLLAFDRRRTEDAVAAFKDLPQDHCDRSFLLGAALLCAGELEAATSEFERGADAKHRPTDCAAGAMLARINVAGWTEQRHRMVRMLHLLPETHAAVPSEIDRLVDPLARAV